MKQQHSPSTFFLGEIFKGHAKDPRTGLEHDLTAIVVAVEDEGHRGSLLLLPTGGRFDANRSFMRAWKAVDAIGEWEVQKQDQDGTKAAWFTLVSDFSAARAIALDERQHGNNQIVRLFKHGQLTPEDQRGLEELGVVPTT